MGWGKIVGIVLLVLTVALYEACSLAVHKTVEVGKEVDKLMNVSAACQNIFPELAFLPDNTMNKKCMGALTIVETRLKKAEADMIETVKTECAKRLSNVGIEDPRFKACSRDLQDKWWRCMEEEKKSTYSGAKLGDLERLPDSVYKWTQSCSWKLH